MTTPSAADTWTRIQELFLEACDLPPEKQDVHLSEANEAPRVVAEVRRMLLAERDEAPAIEKRLLASSPDRQSLDISHSDPTSETWVGRRIGAYRVERLIGEGGMGQVFEAARADQQFHKRVAIKILRRQAAATDDARRRFAMERQVLARLEHPNIAQLVDGGELEDGTPYLVMEYVEGLALDEFCDQAQLSVDQRLQLFLEVCAAVQFAHSHLVIHRDLKPGNILVEPTTESSPSSSPGSTSRPSVELDGPLAGRVRLLDFGIAKLLEPEALDVSLLLTQARYRPMTPLYAAPEQFAGETLTTATDVYALGALLFALLTGDTPHPTEGSSRAFEDRVRHQPARTPTEALAQAAAASLQSTVGNEAAAAGAQSSPDARARARATTIEGLRRQLRGDIERILQKALHHDPERRYATAGELGADLRRYLRGEAISVRDDTVRYRVRVFLRRNRLLASAVGVFVLALMVLSGLLARQTFLAQRAAQRADDESNRSRAVAATLVDLFSTADARQGPTGGEIPVDEFLERMERSADSLEADPSLRAELLVSLGQIYAGRDESRKALAVFDRAASAHREAYGGEFPDERTRDRQLAIDHQAARAAALVDEADGLERLARSLSHHYQVHGAADPRTLTAAFDHAHRQPPGPAIASLDRLEGEMAIAHGERSVEVARVLRSRGEKYSWAGQHQDALRDFESALAIFEREFGTDHPETLETLGELTGSLPMPAGLPRVYELLARQERVFGADSGPVAETLDTVGVTLVRQGDLEGGAEALQRSWEIQRRVHGETSTRTLNTARNVAILSGILGDYSRGVPLMRLFVENVTVDRSIHFGQVQLAFLEARAEPTPDRLRRSIGIMQHSLHELDARRTGSADRYPGDARLFLARLLLADTQPGEALVLAHQALDDRLDDEQEDTGRIVQARFFVARAEAALERSGSRDQLREALVRYEAWGRHERLEVELAREQLAGAEP